MPELSRVLCPVDFSEFSTRAYRHALSLASHYGARLLVQHVVEQWRYPCVEFAPSPELVEDFYKELSESGEAKLQQFVKTCPNNEVRPELVVHQGVAPDCILAFAKCENVDLIVMGTHGRRGLDRLMLGSVTERVMRAASCPVLTVHKPLQDLVNPDQQPGRVHLSRILFCTDFSDSSRRALDHAISLAAEYNAELTLLHVLEDPPFPARIPGAMTSAVEQLDELTAVDKARKGSIRSMVRIGKPYQQIIQLALDAHTDLVIMAVRGRGALEVAVFGSTTYRVMQLGPCPVLAVHV